MPRTRPQWFRVLAVSLATLLLACPSSRWLSGSEFALLDHWMRTRPPRAPSSSIALVGIDRDDIENHKRARPPQCACGLVPRTLIGGTISRLKAAGARVVAVDIAFGQTCPVAGHDAPLRAALNQPGKTVLIASADQSPDRIYLRDPPAELTGQGDVAIASAVMHGPRNTTRGVSMIQRGSVTHAEAKELSPLTVVGHEYMPFCVAACGAFEGDADDVVGDESSTVVYALGATVPVWPTEDIFLLEPYSRSGGLPENNHVMLLDWAGPTGTFPTYSMREVLTGSDGELAACFAGKIVILGSLAERKRTPFDDFTPRPAAPPLVDQSGERTMAGIEVQANAIDCLLQQRFVRAVPRYWTWMLLAFGVLIATLTSETCRAHRAGLLVLAEIVAVAIVARQLIRADVWLFAVIPSSAIAFAGLTSGALGYARARREAAALARQVAAQEQATSTIVHDLKQPLAAISALAEVLRRRQTQSDGEAGSPEIVGLILREVKRALGDIDGLLAASASGNLTLQRQDFDIAALLRDLAVTQSMKSRLHKVEVDAPEEGVMVYGDARYLARALDNLIDNAMKYWPDGGTVAVTVAANEGDIEIRVVDHGLGIERHQLGRIFERYERALPKGAPNIKGTGIGLFSVKCIIEAHGGSVSVQSEVGQGSTFTVLLPTPLHTCTEPAPGVAG